MAGLMFNRLYAAMSDRVDRGGPSGFIDKHVRWHHHHAKLAEKFIFVTPAFEVYDFGVELLKNNLLRLPYASCYFQTTLCFSDGHDHVGYFATDDMEDHTSISILPMSTTGIGMPTLIKDDGFHYASVERSVELPSYIAGAFIALLAFLDTKGTKLERIAPKEGVNAKRERQGKRPIPEYTVVKVDPEIVKQYAKGSGTHASPRPHPRRGHLATIYRGTDRERKIIKPPCFVMAKPGLVPPSKTYRVDKA
jgi:hypothetical protein